MSGIWNRTLVYLGLREEAEELYDEQEPERFVTEDDPHAEPAPERRGAGGRRAPGAADDDEGTSSQRPVVAASREREARASERERRTAAAVRGEDDVDARDREDERERGGVVRTRERLEADERARAEAERRRSNVVRPRERAAAGSDRVAGEDRRRGPMAAAGADEPPTRRSGHERGSGRGAGDASERAPGRGRPGDTAREGEAETTAERPLVGRTRQEQERTTASGNNVRPLRGNEVQSRSGHPAITARAALIEVKVFDDVEAIGARYRTGQPVVIDASGADKADARRVVDFVSGLTFGLRGRLTKVGTRAFLLVPDGVELPSEEHRRLEELGYRVSRESRA
jgi:cell division inhibitor SepF